MYKTLIVDDEPWNTKGLAKTISEINRNFIIVDTAYNGFDALRIIEEQHPDVIFTDIVMPEMDGIGLIREARKRGISSLFIILTGYAEFDYAREALSLGVFEYILKPVDREILSHVLDNAERLLGKGHEFIDFEKNIEIISLLDSSAAAEDQKIIETIQSMLPFRKRYDYFAAVLVYNDNKAVIEFSSGDFEVSSLAYGLKKWLYFISFQDKDAFIRTMKGFDNSHGLSVGISQIYESTMKIRKAWKESLIALYNANLRNSSGAFFYNSDKNLSAINHVKEIVRKKMDVREDGIGQFLVLLPSLLRENQIKAEELEPIYNKIIKKLVDIYPELTEEYFIPSFDLLVRNFDTIEEVFDSIKDSIKDSIELSKEHHHSPNGLIKEILNYLEVHIEENPSLSDLANKFYINSSYLSQVFKKETGRTYSNIKNEMKVALAKQYLKNTSLPIDLICEKCGCYDYFHFNKMFKKYTGQTPSQYRG